METTARTIPITGKEGAEIELSVAADWTKNHRERHPHNSISQFFGNEILQKLLNQPGCLGIRIYYANSQKLNGWQKFILAISNFLRKYIAGAVGEDHFILVGATAEGLDMLPRDKKVNASYMATTSGATEGTVVEQAHPCPGSAGCPKNVLTGGN
ncbi:MAG TPA: hypothetical protein VHS53_02250 [Mucilaginibacter sp.]|jgi:hypothetical protein|nr:hypothetical protein [Mucilaginibacter sp.]